MNAKVNEHQPTPSAVRVPVYRHASETQRSDNDAGGKLRQQYEWNAPQPKVESKQ